MFCMPFPRSVLLRAVLSATVVATVATGAAEAAPFRLTNPAVDTFDDWPSIVATGTGFHLSWQRFLASGQSGVMANRFDATGRAGAAALTLVAPAVLIGRPRLLPAVNGKITAVWGDPVTGITARGFDATTGAMTGKVALTRSSTVFFDPVRLVGGQVAVSHTALDLSVPTNIRDRVSLTLVGPAFGPIAEDRPVTGSDNPMIGPASFDHTVVGQSNGGALNFYRDRADGHLYLVKSSFAGGMAPTRVRVDTTAMRPQSAAEKAYFRVQAVRLGDGRYAVAWTSPETSTLFGQSVRLRFLDATGKPIGVDQRVNASTVGGQFDPRLVALPNGRLGVAWTQDEGTTRYHRIRWYGADGVALGAPRTLRSDTEVADFAGSQLISMSDGRVLQVWRGRTATFPRYAIWGEFLTPPR